MTIEFKEQNKLKLLDQAIADFEAFSPDLKGGLAGTYVRSLFQKIQVETGAVSPEAINQKGKEIFYGLARHTLGPIATAYTDFALKMAEGKVVFPARDATPYYVIAKRLVKTTPLVYPVTEVQLANPFFNRKLWGIDDELDAGAVLDLKSQNAHLFLTQEVGFGSMITFVEQGAWGTMADMIKRNYPDQPFKVMFFFSHIPNSIFGFTNRLGFKEGDLETISDTFEGVPKLYLRPTALKMIDGNVVIDLENKKVTSPLIRSWAEAAIKGFDDAALDFLGNQSDPREEIEKILSLSQKAAQTGEFTGVLPYHTPTWSDGESWKNNWP